MDGIKGTVQLEIVIGEDGSVTEAKVLASPRGDLSQAALAAVKQWKYEPYKLKGQAIPTQTQVNINFNLN
jgi:protein TonB